MELKALLEQLVLEAEDEATQAQLNSALQVAFNNLGTGFKKNKEDIEQDVQQAKELKESFTVAATISLLLSMPSIIKMIAKALSAINTLVKKLMKKSNQEEDQSKVLQMLLTAADKWYNVYIKGFMWILQTSGFYQKANITDKALQRRFAEVLYYTVLAGLAVHSGIQSIDAVKQVASDFSEKGLSNINMDAFLKAKDSVVSSATVKQFANVLFKNKI